MDRVGGDYRSYLALLEDDRALEDVELVMYGESDAARIRQLEEKRGR